MSNDFEVIKNGNDFDIKIISTNRLTESEILEKLKISNDFTIDDLEYIKNTDPVMLHHGLGTFIRNKYKLWEIKWIPEIRDGIDYSSNHPDAVSNRIVTQFYNFLNKN